MRLANMRTLKMMSGSISQITPCRGMQALRLGLTLIEVLVVICLISLLMSLLLPAVLRSNEGARRLLCVSRLGQVAKGCHSFHAALNRLPAARKMTNSPTFPDHLSNWGQLLPYIGQEPAFRQISHIENGNNAYMEPPGSSANQELWNHTIEALVCPSDRVASGQCNFRACIGSNYTPWRDRMQGAFWSRGSDPWQVSLKDIRDGLSQTVLCSERMIGDYDLVSYSAVNDLYFASSPGFTLLSNDEFASMCQTGFPGTGTHRSFLGATWLFRGLLYTSYDHILGPNSPIPDCGVDGDFSLSGAAVTARSWHNGGVNVAFADGNARFVNQNIALSVWRAMGTRAGNEPVSDW